MAMKTLWFWKGLPLNDKWNYVANYATDEHEHPSLVSSDICPTEAQAASSCTLDDSGLLVVHLDDEQWASVPELWYIFEEINSPVHMFALHAMTGGNFKKGTVVCPRDISNFGVRQSDRVGFVRWFKEDSRIQQITVVEEWRRRRVSTALIGVADILVVSGSLGRFLNGGDITTSDGEALRAAWSHSSRVLPRTGSVDNQS